ncbi:uncharacterized protein LOC124252997 isoform X2 [Haliotis rubra]|uniref:uncharacterized protein LOC124252997 isoform X2 n=1 Tax=Haliotis rubra TaxID=36100 RepID=UPI001EE63593|nr:uncharacterized protein LOC124252997 isoform X2 [Haliotis rubra]
MRTTFNLLILLFLWMEASEGGWTCKQYLSHGSSFYITYYCPHYCCGSLYDDDCCFYDPRSSWSSWTTSSTSSPSRWSGSSSKSSPSNVGKIVGYSIGGIATFLTLVCACLSISKKKSRVQSYPRNLDTHPTGITSSNQYPGTTGPASTSPSAARTPAQSALPGMIHV